MQTPYSALSVRKGLDGRRDDNAVDCGSLSGNPSASTVAPPKIYALHFVKVQVTWPRCCRRRTGDVAKNKGRERAKVPRLQS